VPSPTVENAQPQNCLAYFNFYPLSPEYKGHIIYGGDDYKIRISEIVADKLTDERYEKGYTRFDPRLPFQSERLQPYRKFETLHDLYCDNIGETQNSNLFRSLAICENDRFLDNSLQNSFKPTFGHPNIAQLFDQAFVGFWKPATYK
jgi:hypothetical protein